MSEVRAQQLERLKQEQARLEELLFLVDATRRPRLQKVLSSMRAEIASLEAWDATPPVQSSIGDKPEPSLPELRQRQSDLEETLFSEPPERRGPVKKLLAQVRAAIEAALERLSSPEEKAVREGAPTTKSAEQVEGGDQAANDEKPSGPPKAA